MKRTPLLAFILSGGLAHGTPLPEQVVVIASRNADALASLPQAIGVVDRDDLATVSAVHPSEALFRVPGVWVSRGNGQESLTAIRSPVFSGAGACGEFLLAENGIPLSAGGFCNVNELFGAHTELAERIEVQRGPGSVVFGGNALHGLINAVTPQPPRYAPLLQGQYETGNHGYQRLSLQSGHHGFLVQFSGTHDGGYKDDSGFDQQKLTLAHHKDLDHLSVDTWLTATHLNQETAGFIDGYHAYANSDYKKANPNPEAYRDAQSWRLASRWQWAPDGDSTLSVTPYLRHNRMRFLQHFLPWQATEENGHDSVGVQSGWQYRNGSLDWLAGIDAEYTDGFLREYQARPFAPTTPAGWHYDYTASATTLAPYARLQWAIDGTWTATAGIRHESIRYDYDNRLPDGSACDPLVSGCRFYRPADRKDRFAKTSPSIGIVGQLGNSLRVFAHAAQGFRAPQATELYRLQGQQAVADIEPTVLNSVELGWTQQLATAQYTVTLFSMRKDNVIYQDSQRWNVDGAKTRHDGVEMSVRWDITPALSLVIDTTWARHQYDSEEALPGLLTPIDGNDIDTAPRQLGSLRLNWRPTERLSTELEWVEMGEYYTNPENLNRYAGHDLLHLRAAFKASPRWTLWTRVHNLTNADYADRADYAFGTERYFIGEPRAVFFGIEGRLF